MSLNIARDALTYWGMTEASLTLIAQRENSVYRVDMPNTDRSWALRLHRPGLRTQAELVSESQWLRALNEGGLGVPIPVASEAGPFCINVGGHWIDMQVWLQGETLEEHSKQKETQPNQATHYEALGKALAQLHSLSDNWTLPKHFERPSWSRDGLLGDDPLWGRFWENPALSEQQKIMLTSFRFAAQQALDERHQTLNYGLIHADLVSENILLRDQNLQLIDFDDSGYGYRLFDLATIILRLQREPGWQALSDTLIKSYSAERPLDVRALDLFLALRACTYIGWIIPRIDEPKAIERCERFIKTGCSHVERWLLS